MRLTLWYLAILAVVFLVFSGVVATATLNNAASEERASLLTMSNQVASTYDAASGKLVFNYPWARGALASGIASPVAKPDTPLGPLDVALLLDANGALVQSFGPATSGGVAQLQQQANKWQSLGASADEDIPMTLLVTPSGGKVAPPDVAEAQYDILFSSIRAGTTTLTLVVGQQFDSAQTLQAGRNAAPLPRWRGT